MLAGDNRTVTVQIRHTAGAAPSNTSVTLWWIDRGHSNPLAAWKVHNKPLTHNAMHANFALFVKSVHVVLFRCCCCCCCFVVVVVAVGAVGAADVIGAGHGITRRAV